MTRFAAHRSTPLQPPRHMRPKRPRVIAIFDPVAALALVDATLAKPPAIERIRRPETAGKLLRRWVLPLDLAPGVNVLADMQDWARGKLKTRALRMMRGQHPGDRPFVLPGRPLVRVLRLSSVEPDSEAGWAKVPVDRLIVGVHRKPTKMPEHLWQAMKGKLPPVGLGWLRDDSPSAVDLRTWWEPAPPKRGCVYVELWTG